MMITVALEHSGDTFTLDTSSPSTTPGGEASIYFVSASGGRSLALKIFAKPGEHNREARVDAWIARPGLIPDSGPNPWHKLALPVDKVYQQQNGKRRFVGYAMVKIDVAGPLASFVHFSERTFWSFRQRLLFLDQFLQICERLETHPHKPQICDISLPNVLVDKDLRPVLCDVDSFQLTIVRGGTPLTLVSPAHLADYLAPELHGRDLTTTVRDETQSRFAIFLLGYQLLMGGPHPFLTRPAEDIAKRITEGAFPFAPGSSYRPPQYAEREWRYLRPEIREFFMTAFVDGHFDPSKRPSISRFRAEIQKEIAQPTPRPAPKKRPIATPPTKRAAVAPLRHRGLRLLRGPRPVAAALLLVVSLCFASSYWSSDPRGEAPEITKLRQMNAASASKPFASQPTHAGQDVTADLVTVAVEIARLREMSATGVSQPFAPRITNHTAPPIARGPSEIDRLRELP
ncbi:MAG: hypothetical protein U0790_04070 [Isosphaeraceae bacterium]